MSRRLPQVYFRHFTDDDVLNHLRGEDADTVRWLSGGASTEESVRNWFAANYENWTNDGPRFVFAIENEHNQLVGMIEVNVDASHFAGLEPGDANVSYGIYPQFRGQGFASAAVLGVEAFMRTMGVKRAIIRAQAQNVASLAVAIRCGYEERGVVVNGAGTEYVFFVKTL